MAKRTQDEEREERIAMEIIVDAYTPEEQAMGWHVYLDENLETPFRARFITERVISPLRKGEQVEVVGMAPRRSASTRCWFRYDGTTVPWPCRYPSWMALA